MLIIKSIIFKEILKLDKSLFLKYIKFKKKNLNKHLFYLKDSGLHLN